MIESSAITFTTHGFLAVSGSSGSEKRRNPYVPILRSTLARMTEPAVGASTCASGSQVWKGHIGTFTAKPRKNAQKTHHCTFAGRLRRISSETSNEYVWNWLKYCQYSIRIPSSISTEPISV